MHQQASARRDHVQFTFTERGKNFLSKPCLPSLQGLERLTKMLFSRAQPKRLGQDVVSGGVLAALATAYVDAINGGAVPTIATAWQVCRAQEISCTEVVFATRTGAQAHAVACG